MMELPLRDNMRSAEVTVAVHPAHRRRGVGTAVVEAMTERGRADGRLVLNSIVDVPLDRVADHASLSFAPKVGFEPMLSGNIRHLTVPMDRGRTEALQAEVARARDADDYRVLTFEAPWPAEYLAGPVRALPRACRPTSPTATKATRRRSGTRSGYGRTTPFGAPAAPAT